MTQTTDADARKKLLERIRKLRALAENAGATEAEALRATEILTKLIAEHAVTETELSIREESKRCGEIIFTTIYNNDLLTKLMLPIERVFQVKTYYRSMLEWDAELDLTFKLMQVHFFGHETDREAAWTVMTICNNAIRNETVLYGKTLGRVKGKKDILLDFETGMTLRLAERINDLRPTGTGLIVLKSQLVTDEFSSMLRSKNIRLGHRPILVGDANSTAGRAGADAANRVDLGQGARVPGTGRALLS